MGVWAAEPFGNDDAADFVAEVEEAKNVGEKISLLERACSDLDLDLDPDEDGLSALLEAIAAATLIEKLGSVQNQDYPFGAYGPESWPPQFEQRDIEHLQRLATHVRAVVTKISMTDSLEEDTKEFLQQLLSVW